MNSFLLFASLMTLMAILACCLIAVPLLLRRQRGPLAGWAAAVVAVLVLINLLLGLAGGQPFIRLR